MRKFGSALIGLLIISILSQQVSAYESHEPIVIYGNEGFASFATNGDGSPENPWIIEDLSITSDKYVYATGGVGRYCVYIQFTTDYFIIRNCHISNHSAFYGIYSFNVSNCIIEGNVIENNAYSGIIFQHSNNIKIMNNTIRNHRESGICFISSPGTVISNNSFKSNQNADITSLSNTNFTLTGNDFEIGISIDGDDPYIPGEPSTPSNNLATIIIAIIIIAIGLLVLMTIMKKRKQ